MSAVNIVKFNDNVYFAERSLVSEKYLTDIKIKKVALYAIATVLITASIAVFTASLIGVVTWPLALISIPLIAISVGLIRYSRCLKDYENLQELQCMRNKAFQSSFSQIIKEHGFGNLQKYRIVLPSLLQEKFIKEYQFSSFSDLIRQYTLHTIRIQDLMPLKMLQKSFAKEIQVMEVNSFFNRFSLESLHQHAIISEKQIQPLYSLYNRFQTQNKELDSDKLGLDRKYPDRQERLLSQLDEEVVIAKQNANRLKRELSKEARTTGYLTTEMMARPYDEDSSRRTRSNGVLLTELTVVPMVQNMADRMLSSGLEAIQRRRQSIIDRKSGEADQVRYNDELKKIEGLYSVRFQTFNQEFRLIQSDIVKEVNL